MEALELIAEINEERRLQLELPINARPGKVRVIVLLPEGESEDSAEAAWTQELAREWAEDWDDPREDIYSLADGEASHAAR